MAIDDRVRFVHNPSPRQRCWGCKHQAWRLRGSAAVYWREWVLCRGCASLMGLFPVEAVRKAGVK